ncbi:MAG: PrsW family intramembrane metalloprotease [Bacteroidetes bacterium]|nr:PrsW family intramembrane metalloprotease [Bacteroidota bacterium]
MYLLSLLLALVPGGLIAFFIWNKDRNNPEPRLHLWLSFILGALITIPAYFLERFAVLQGLDDPTRILSILFTAFIIVSLTEELFKAICLLVYPYRQTYFDEPLDGIVYAVMIAMGFATTENVIYALQHGLVTTIVRAFTAVPAHGAFAIILGYYVGRSKFEPARKWQLIGTGFGLSVFLHGIYDLFLVQELYDWLIGLAIPVLIFSIYLSLRMVKVQQEESDKRHHMDSDLEG